MVFDGLETEYKTITYASGTTANFTSGTIADGTVTTLTSTTATITTASGANSTFTSGNFTNLQIGQLYAGSNTGLYTQHPAGAIISGGTWAIIVSGATPYVTIAAASQVRPLGVNVAIVASGGTANILRTGIHYFLANGNTVAGDAAGVGGAAALTGVVSLASGATQDALTVGTILNTQASGTSAKVPVLLNLA